MLTPRAALRSCLVALSFAVPLAFAAAARADVACGDQTCPKNYECQAQPVACPEIACAADQPNCTQPDCSGTVDTCVALPCTSDSDCADGMVCYTSTQETCATAPACAKGQDCPQASDAGCTTSTSSACVPKYMLPCDTDADCGAGFSCEEEQNCGCSGSAGTGSASSGSASSGGTPVPPAADAGAGDPPPPSPNPAEPADAGAPMADAGTPPPADCSCQPSGTKACNLKTVACSADSDCPSGFTCGDNPSGTCYADSNGGGGCTADPAKICLPPYARLVSGGHYASDSSNGTGTGAPVPPTNATPETSGAGTTPKSEPQSSGDGGGCSIVRTPGDFGVSFGFAALALVGLAGVRRRRAR